MMGRLFRTGILQRSISAEIQWLQIFLVDLIIWNEEEAYFKKIMQAYEVELNYTEDKKPVFIQNATEFRVILKILT